MLMQHDHMCRLITYHSCQVEWETNGEELLTTLRGIETPAVNVDCINQIFGRGMNGIRERA